MENLSENNFLPIEMETTQAEDSNPDSQITPRRVITDTGDIVENHFTSLSNLKIVTTDKGIEIMFSVFFSFFKYIFYIAVITSH